MMIAKPKRKPSISRARLGPLEPFAFRVTEFCESHGISVAMFYVLRQRGEGPDTMQVGDRVLVSREAAKRWREKMEKNKTAESKAPGGE